MPSAAARGRPTPSGTGTTAASGTLTSSARPPVIGRHHTGVPAGSADDSTTSPAASAPGTYGGSGTSR